MTKSYGSMLRKRHNFQSAVISWHRKNNRDFPWRKTTDPFRIIIAQITLKLTGAWKAETAYNSLVKHYGTPEKMANAPITKIRPIFQPLGLFNRSYTLINVAKQINTDFNGRVPRTYDELVSIKGIGQYMANAVLCFAYNKRAPIVDGSISRLFKRCLNYSTNKMAHLDKELWELAHEFLPEKKYKAYSLGILDLGALICKHRNPIHDQCPLKTICCMAKKIKHIK